ncbi:MAG TPA: permease prefix domain 1-containing protein, partial [Candidatus Dormibacteraeota bacterium]|nr:permease prefix domain 1-containing protein [Candidatus Dormibacteraeota bacterium]
MQWAQRFWLKLQSLFRPNRSNERLNDEIQFHLDQQIAENLARGMCPEEARHAARRTFGSPTCLKEETRDSWGWAWLEQFVSDFRYAARTLGKSPALTLAVLLSLTIGVGANTAIFSLLNAAILKPLPIEGPDSLRIVEWTNQEFPEGVSNINGDFSRISGGGFQASSVGANLYRALAREQTVLAPLMGIADPNPVAIAVDRLPAEQVSLQYVSANFFQGLRVLPVVGRPFSDDEDRVGLEPVVIVSHRFWVGRLGATSDTLNRSIRINNVSARIVGVAPRDFFGPRAGQWTDVYAPLA